MQLWFPPSPYPPSRISVGRQKETHEQPRVPLDALTRLFKIVQFLIFHNGVQLFGILGENFSSFELGHQLFTVLRPIFTTLVFKNSFSVEFAHFFAEIPNI